MHSHGMRTVHMCSWACWRMCVRMHLRAHASAVPWQAIPPRCCCSQDDKGKFAVVKTVDALQELHKAGTSQRAIAARAINYAAKAFLPQFNKAMFAAGNYFGTRWAQHMLPIHRLAWLMGHTCAVFLLMLPIHRLAWLLGYACIVFLLMCLRASCAHACVH